MSPLPREESGPDVGLMTDPAAGHALRSERPQRSRARSLPTCWQACTCAATRANRSKTSLTMPSPYAPLLFNQTPDDRVLGSRSFRLSPRGALQDAHKRLRTVLHRADLKTQRTSAHASQPERQERTRPASCDASWRTVNRERWFATLRMGGRRFRPARP